MNDPNYRGAQQNLPHRVDHRIQRVKALLVSQWVFRFAAKGPAHSVQVQYAPSLGNVTVFFNRKSIHTANRILSRKTRWELNQRLTSQLMMTVVIEDSARSPFKLLIGGVDFNDLRKHQSAIEQFANNLPFVEDPNGPNSSFPPASVNRDAPTSSGQHQWGGQSAAAKSTVNAPPPKKKQEKEINLLDFSTELDDAASGQDERLSNEFDILDPLNAGGAKSQPSSAASELLDIIWDDPSSNGQNTTDVQHQPVGAEQATNDMFSGMDIGGSEVAKMEPPLVQEQPKSVWEQDSLLGDFSATKGAHEVSGSAFDFMGGDGTTTQPAMAPVPAPSQALPMLMPTNMMGVNIGAQGRSMPLSKPSGANSIFDPFAGLK